MLQQESRSCRFSFAHRLLPPPGEWIRIIVVDPAPGMEPCLNCISHLFTRGRVDAPVELGRVHLIRIEEKRISRCKAGRKHLVTRNLSVVEKDR